MKNARFGRCRRPNRFPLQFANRGRILEDTANRRSPFNTPCPNEKRGTKLVAVKPVTLSNLG